MTVPASSSDGQTGPLERISTRALARSWIWPFWQTGRSPACTKPFLRASLPLQSSSLAFH